MELIGYASRTGTRRNLAALRAAGWRLLVSATGVLRNEGFRYALDNGAWTAHQSGVPFNEELFMRALTLLGKDADWVVVPDIVAGGSRSLDFSRAWLSRVLHHAPKALIAVQDGMKTEDVAGLLSERVGIFVGGTTNWKLQTMRAWGSLARDVGCWCHVGRVNTARRIAACQEAGAMSFDGTAATRFANALPLLDAARRQGSFAWH